jgi:hypothetical protein
MQWTLASNLRKAKSVISTCPIPNLVQLHVHRSFTTSTLLPPQRGSRMGEVDRLQSMSNLPNDFDQVAVVIDWLDACRTRNLDALLDLYAQDASLECKCEGLKVHEGRAELASYWQPRLDASSPTAFGLDGITPAADGVMLDYLSFEGRPVRIFFTFNEEGKILQSRCQPSASTPRSQSLGF